jgi:hypothetical protein
MMIIGIKMNYHPCTMIGQGHFRYTRNTIIWFGKEELAEKSSTQEVYHMYMMWSFLYYPYTGDDESEK